jgi:DNA-directed RNA polymerase II subunit RPB1
MIKGVRFGLVNPKELSQTFLVETPYTWNQNVPVPTGLNDRHLGTADDRYSCLTCGQKSYCPGHEGHIVLAKPCFIPNMLDHVIKTLRCVCHVCSKLLIPEEEIAVKTVDWISDIVTNHAAYRFCGQGKKDEETGELIGCGAHRANYTKIDGLHIKGTLFDPIVDDDAGEDGVNINTTTTTTTTTTKRLTGKQFLAKQITKNLPESSSKKRVSRTINKKKTEFAERTIIITPDKAHMILKKISAHDSELMGFAKGDHPSWMIWTVFPIIPPPERPSMAVSPQKRGEDDLTYALFNLMKANQDLLKKIQQGAHASKISPSYELLQFRVATCTTNDLQKQPKAKHRSGREVQGAAQKLKGKEGLVRQNMMGKRVDQSARTVITGDSSLSVEELGVPLEIAMTNTYPVPVTEANFDECWERVLKGPFVYGGANSIIKTIGGKNYHLDLRITQDRASLVLKKGMIVERHLQNGDWILFNRQPSLHRMSMMAHRVKIVKGNTFRLNESVTTP